MSSPNTTLALLDRGFSVESVKSNRDAIQQLLKDVLVEGIDRDYAVIPGTKKKTLLKPGAEKICSLFGIAVEPSVEAIRDGDDVTFRVTCRMTSIHSGVYLGSGIGEASTLESKYAWREAVCQEEYEAADARKRRIHWKKGYQGAPPSSVPQVREDPNDKMNTALKMGKKRSMIDGVLSVTAASDTFTQDLEPLLDNRTGKSTAPVTGAQAAAGAPTEAIISSDDSKKFFGIWKNNGRTKEIIQEYLRIHCGGITDDRKMPQRCFAEACRWAKSGEPVPPAPKPPAPKTAPTAAPAAASEENPDRNKVMQLFGILDIDLIEQSRLLSDYHGRLPELASELTSRLPED
jgi:hypothetical protein